MEKLIKKAFTLAEVLITLTIIGFIAAITIPTLMSRTNDQQTLAKLKKAHSILSNATKMVIAEEGEINLTYEENWSKIVGAEQIFSKIKQSKKNEEMDWQDTIGALGTMFQGSKYIIADDGIGYGYHYMISTGNHSNIDENILPIASAVKINNTDSSKNIVYGFYIKSDGTVSPAGNPDDEDSVAYWYDKAHYVNMTCPSAEGLCTYYTLKTGKVRKVAGEWIE